MNTLNELKTVVTQKANDSHHEVLARLLNKIHERLLHFSDCARQKALEEYVGSKIALHRAKKRGTDRDTTSVNTQRRVYYGTTCTCFVR